MDTGWIVPAITAATGGTATVIGAIALYRKNSTASSGMKFALTQLVIWAEETDWTGPEGGKVIDRVPRRVRIIVYKYVDADELPGGDEDERG